MLLLTAASRILLHERRPRVTFALLRGQFAGNVRRPPEGLYAKKCRHDLHSSFPFADSPEPTKGSCTFDLCVEQVESDRGTIFSLSLLRSAFLCAKQRVASDPWHRRARRLCWPSASTSPLSISLCNLCRSRSRSGRTAGNGYHRFSGWIGRWQL